MYLSDKESGNPPTWWFESILKNARVRQHDLLVVLSRIDEALSHEGLCYWLTGGSALGALRHHGFIPHDDDLDLACWTHEMPSIERAVLQRAFPACEGEGEEAHFKDSMWQGTLYRSLHVRLKSGCRPVIVDFFHRPHKEEDHVLDCKSFETLDEILPLRMVSFCNMSLPVCGGVESYLDRVYPRWQSEACVFAHNDTFSLRNVWRIPLEQYLEQVKQLEPA